MPNQSKQIQDSYLEWKNWDSNNFGQCDKRHNRYYTWHINRACSPINQPLQILEVGFGNGSFMGWAKEQGHEIVGIESNAELVKRAIDNGYSAYQNLADIKDINVFDLIVAFDVIEHIEPKELIGFLLQLHQYVKPNGRLLFRFPNGDSPFGLTHQNGDLTHVNFIGKGKIKQIAAITNWDILVTGESSWLADPLCPRNFRHMLRWLLRQQFEKLIGFMYFDSKVDFSPNLIVVLKSL